MACKRGLATSWKASTLFQTNAFFQSMGIAPLGSLTVFLHWKENGLICMSPWSTGVFRVNLKGPSLVYWKYNTGLRFSPDWMIIVTVPIVRSASCCTKCFKNREARLLTLGSRSGLVILKRILKTHPP